jgi:hypothetical protein
MAQPKMGLIRYLLGRTFYPDNSYTRDSAGNPIRPYDMATDTMAEFMGVRVDPQDEPLQAATASNSADPDSTAARRRVMRETSGSSTARAHGPGAQREG